MLLTPSDLLSLPLHDAPRLRCASGEHFGDSLAERRQQPSANAVSSLWLMLQMEPCAEHDCQHLPDADSAESAGQLPSVGAACQMGHRSSH